jgi:hypothetical protein
VKEQYLKLVTILFRIPAYELLFIGQDLVSFLNVNDKISIINSKRNIYPICGGVRYVSIYKCNMTILAYPLSTIYIEGCRSTNVEESLLVSLLS